MEHYFTNNENLKSELRTIIYKYQDYVFSFFSDLGIFSKDRVDFASKLLVESYIENGKSNVKMLDLGCGYGFIGVALSKIMNANVDMVDINKRCLHLTEMNIKSNDANCNCFESDVYSNVNSKYDVIITNPPIRVGKEKLRTFFDDAKNYLNETGEMWFVINKDHGAKSMIEYLKESYDVNVLCKSKGFYIIILKSY